MCAPSVMCLLISQTRGAPGLGFRAGLQNIDVVWGGLGGVWRCLSIRSLIPHRNEETADEVKGLVKKWNK